MCGDGEKFGKVLFAFWRGRSANNKRSDLSSRACLDRLRIKHTDMETHD